MNTTSSLAITLVLLMATTVCADQIPLTSLIGVLNAPDITLGPDVGEEKPGTPFQELAVNVRGDAGPARKAWVALYPDAVYGDSTVSTSVLIAEINGEKGGGVAMFGSETAGSRTVVFAMENAKSTNTARLLLVDLNTGAITQLAQAAVTGMFLYGGTIPPPNCDHHQGQLDWHMYCQWFKVTLTAETLADGKVRYTGRIFMYGNGPLDDMSRADPNDPILTPVKGSPVVWTGARPNGVPTEGFVGVAMEGRQARVEVSAVNLNVSANGSSTPPPFCP